MLGAFQRECVRALRSPFLFLERSAYPDLEITNVTFPQTVRESCVGKRCAGLFDDGRWWF